jgi:hypothetical protein
MIYGEFPHLAMPVVVVTALGKEVAGVVIGVNMIEDTVDVFVFEQMASMKSLKRDQTLADGGWEGRKLTWRPPI